MPIIPSACRTTTSKKDVEGNETSHSARADSYPSRLEFMNLSGSSRVHCIAVPTMTKYSSKCIDLEFNTGRNRSPRKWTTVRARRNKVFEPCSAEMTHSSEFREEKQFIGPLAVPNSFYYDVKIHGTVLRSTFGSCSAHDVYAAPFEFELKFRRVRSTHGLPSDQSEGANGNRAEKVKRKWGKRRPRSQP